MATGCGWDLVAFASSANRAALTAVPLALGSELYTADGIPGTGTQVYPKEAGTIFGIGVVSETAAAVEWRVHKTTDANYNRSDRFTKLQTAAYAGGPAICRMNYPIMLGDLLTADILNAGAVLDAVGVFIGKGKIPEFSETLPPGAMPVNAIPATFTATVTHIADSWSPIARVIFDDYNLKTDKRYKIVGMSAYSATGCLHRLRFYEGPDVGNAPGILGGDTAHISQTVFGNFGSFAGLNGVGIQTVAVAADATTCGTLWLVEQ